MIMIAAALANNPKFKDKILSKALFQDEAYFRATYGNRRLAEFLEYGWEMSYGAPDTAGRLRQYLSSGMQKSTLAIGVTTNRPASAAAAARSAADVQRNGFGGVMVYNVTNQSGPFLSAIAEVQFGQAVNTDAGCLR